MPTGRIIALIAGALTTFAAFIAGMVLIFYSEYTSSGERLIFVSMALAPVAMVSVMIGYAVWWFVMFLTALFVTNRNPEDGS